MLAAVVADRSTRCQTKRQHGLLESLVMAPIPWQRIPCARVVYETRRALQFRCSHLTVPCLVTARARNSLPALKLRSSIDVARQRRLGEWPGVGVWKTGI